ncbi:MAG: HP1 family phage holin [Cellvibrionaceae bacterium]
MENQLVERIASNSAYATSAVAMTAGMSVNEWLALGGFLLGFATFVVNWVYKHRSYQLQVRKSDGVSGGCSRCD